MDFESEEVCQKAKETMEDCWIDGNKVTVAFARTKVQRKSSAAAGGAAEVRPADQNLAGDVSLWCISKVGSRCLTGPVEVLLRKASSFLSSPELSLNYNPRGPSAR